jgi:hypothetical protein
MDVHRIQSSIYASLLQLSHTELINVKNDNLSIEIIPSSNLKKINDLTRAIFALKYSQHRKNILMEKLKDVQLNILPINFVPTCCISVDIESFRDFKYNEEIIIEIGAVAFSVDGSIYDTYHDILEYSEDSVLEPSHKRVERKRFTELDFEYLTGLNIENVLCNIDSKEHIQSLNNEMVDKFHEWVKYISGRRCFLHWGGNETKTLKLEELGKSFDGLNMFRSFSKREHLNKLSDAKNQLLGEEYPFEAHRAFEDAVITASVFLTYTDV